MIVSHLLHQETGGSHSYSPIAVIYPAVRVRDIPPPIMSNPSPPRGALARIPLTIWTEGILSCLSAKDVSRTVKAIRPTFADYSDQLKLADKVGPQGRCGHSISHHQAWQRIRVVIVITVSVEQVMMVNGET